MVNASIKTILAPLALVAIFGLAGCKEDNPKTAPEPQEGPSVVIEPQAPEPKEPAPQPPELTDIEKGKMLSSVCASCHSLQDSSTRVGPSLYGILNKDIASVDGFSYSSALLSLDGPWNEANLAEFIHDPQGFASGTNMPPLGIKHEDAKKIVAYLKSIQP